MIRIAAAVVLLATPAYAQSAESSVILTFETGARTGAVMVALFDSAAAFDGDSGRPVAVKAISASGPVVATFENLPAGDYAVKAFHDLNGDGEMNTNPFGMPVEPYAFSNNAVGNMGPARWNRARFTVSGETAQTISIR
ncbi:MAG: DUF2141 domain-containing protein [Brevundimonas sp.]|uniref:DUF2141 domain-containing protein n=1 Tax=Brevundimonas sp. TaxID=1871086 RepID=UPI002732A829|nr:DUF2141 domain-containing protein [Brevundimonas sp.]MDP3369487.1 DUF2141 domain-containing protein [Brevundimonas sp.]MDP3655500.1 DUF2141 domain-containing protein [Brevundimonas sp.]MDZ4108859.1 DUF2141 domain-containing protein [Brevundimonas sp.]